MLSVLTKQFSKIGIFCDMDVYVAVRKFSSKSRSILSTLNPIPNRSVRGMLRWIISQFLYTIFVFSTTGNSVGGGELL